MASRHVALVAAVCVLASCGGSGGTSTSAVSAPPATSSPVPGPEVSIVPPEPPPSSTVLAGDGAGELSVLVSASGGGGLLGSPGIEHVVVDETADATSPWIRFDLVVPYQALEANTVVFSPDDGWSRPAGDPPQVRVDGPLCTGAMVCDGDARSLPIAGGATSTLSFEVRRGGDLAALTEGSLTVDVDGVFDFSVPAVADQPVTFTLRIDVVPATPAPSGDTTPRDTGSAAVTVIGGGFDLLTFPLIALADNRDELAEILGPARQPVDVEALAASVDWPTQAVVVVAIPTDACPPVLEGIAVDDGVGRPAYVNPGYSGCVQPLLSHTSIATVDRDLLDGVGELELPAHQPFFDQAVTIDVDLQPSSGSAPTTTFEVDFGESRGTAALPPRGEAAVATLDDGSPVMVVHHHDGTVSALDPRAAASTSTATEPASLLLVQWTAGTRHFLSGGAWDEYGRRLDGFRDTDLQGFATRVVDGAVEIGGPVDPPTGAPIAAGADPPAMADVAITPAHLLAVDEAVALDIGRSSWVDADVVIGPEGAHLCDAPTVPGSIAIEACPPGSPTVDGIDPVDDSRSVWFGPLLVTRTESGFTRIAAIGGYAGVAL